MPYEFLSWFFAIIMAIFFIIPYLVNDELSLLVSKIVAFVAGGCLLLTQLAKYLSGVI